MLAAPHLFSELLWHFCNALQAEGASSSSPSWACLTMTSKLDKANVVMHALCACVGVYIYIYISVQWLEHPNNGGFPPKQT